MDPTGTFFPAKRLLLALSEVQQKEILKRARLEVLRGSSAAKLPKGFCTELTRFEVVTDAGLESLGVGTFPDVRHFFTASPPITNLFQTQKNSISRPPRDRRTARRDRIPGATDSRCGGLRVCLGFPCALGIFLLQLYVLNLCIYRCRSCFPTQTAY